MSANEAGGDGKTEAGAVAAGIEGLEDLGLVGNRQARTVIRHGEMNRPRLPVDGSADIETVHKKILQLISEASL